MHIKIDSVYIDIYNYNADIDYLLNYVYLNTDKINKFVYIEIDNVYIDMDKNAKYCQYTVLQYNKELPISI